MTSTEENITVTIWADKNIVNVVSSFSEVQPIVKAKCFPHATKSLLEIARPNAVRIYNLHMGGVKLIDSFVSLVIHRGISKGV